MNGKEFEKVEEGLKLIRKNLGRFIEDRGRHTHNYDINYEPVSGLEAVSIFCQVEPDETAFKLLETYVYRKAKFRLASDIKFTSRFMETFIDRTLNGYMKEIEYIINDINALIDKHKDGSEERHEAWIDQTDEVLLGLIRKRAFQQLSPKEDEVAAG